MENRIILEGEEATRYRSLLLSIGKGRIFSESSTLLEVLSHIFTLHYCIRDAAMALGLDENYSQEVDIKEAKRIIENAYETISCNSFTIDHWCLSLCNSAKATEHLERFTTEVKE